MCFRSGVVKILVSVKDSCETFGGVDIARLEYALEVKLESELVREGKDVDEESDGE